MPSKHCAPTKASSGAPKRKKKMTISEKVKLLDMIKEGRNYAFVARQYGVNESTVLYIKKEEANIRKTAYFAVFHFSWLVLVSINSNK